MKLLRNMYNPHIILKFLILCLILALISIWIPFFYYTRSSILGNDAHTSFLPTLNVLRTEVVEKASCKDDSFCELEGDIRVEAQTGTIYVITHNETISRKTWVIRPYVRYYIYQVRHWTVKVVRYGEEEAARCTEKHYNPAILFSGSGLSSNHYHSYSDILFPLYMTSFGYIPEVHLLITDYRHIIVLKAREILHRLSRYPIVDIDRQYDQVHCYCKMFVGLKFHGDLIVDKSSPEYAAGLSMQSFRQFIRETYSLERSTLATKPILQATQASYTPRLMIVSRKASRVLLNEDEISEVAKEIGFDVVSIDAELSTNRTRFSQIVNSCDVMVGVHGAGLTHMVFLPDNAVMVQIVPFGSIDWTAEIEFRDPCLEMNLRYLLYKIKLEESTLIQQYGPDDPIITDPESKSFMVIGWDAFYSIYMHNVNLTIDVGRFKPILVEAMNLLRRH